MSKTFRVQSIRVLFSLTILVKFSLSTSGKYRVKGTIEIASLDKYICIYDVIFVFFFKNREIVNIV
jgi:hypothetical protein